MRQGIIALVVRYKITGRGLATVEEVSASRWATEAEIAELADEAYAVGILDAPRNDQPPAIRQHDGVNLL